MEEAKKFKPKVTILCMFIIILTLTNKNTKLNK